MVKTSDEVIERTKGREVEGVFHSRAALETAVEALMLAGFDRADIDTLANLDGGSKSPQPIPIDTKGQPNLPRVEPEAVVISEDVTATRMVLMGISGAICAMVAVYWVLASGGGTVPAVLAALLAGIAGGRIGYIATARLSGGERTKALEGLAYGFKLCVRVRSLDREGKAKHSLGEHGGRAIWVHEITIEEWTEDIPFSSLRPDPWLGEDRLGQP